MSYLFTTDEIVVQDGEFAVIGTSGEVIATVHLRSGNVFPPCFSPLDIFQLKDKN